MNGFVAFFKGLLTTLLPHAWQRTVCELGLLTCFAIGFTLVAWQSPAAKYAFLIGSCLAVLPILVRVAVRGYIAFSLWDRSQMLRRLEPYAVGRILYCTAYISPTDEVLYLVVEQTGVRSDGGIGGTVPHRVALLRPLDDSLLRQPVTQNEGWQYTLLLGPDNDWEKATGMTFDGLRPFVYHLVPSYGNRGANKSATITYYGIDEDVTYTAHWSSSDTETHVNGGIEFEPNAGVPLALKRHAVTHFWAADFRGWLGDILAREMRAWQSTYQGTLHENKSVTVDLYWQSGPQPSAVPSAHLRNENYYVDGFRTAAVIRVRSDGAWSVVFVGHAFPSCGTDGTVLYIEDATSIYKYIPETCALQYVGLGFQLLIEDGRVTGLRRGLTDRQPLP